MNKTAKPESSGVKDHFKKELNQINKNNNYYWCTGTASPHL